MTGRRGDGSDFAYEYDDEGYRRDLSAKELAFQRLYGPWEPYDPIQARQLLAPTGIDWWVAGGWAVEAFTGVARHHEDIDVSIFRRDLGRLRERLADRLHVWAAASGGLRPLDEATTSMPSDADQVWLRAHALAPWRADVLLNPDQDGRWVNRRDRAHVAPLDAVTWERAGIRYLNPEIVLAFKAKHVRPKDQHDFAAAAPLLDARAREWLSQYLHRKHPGLDWLQRLGAASTG